MPLERDASNSNDDLPADPQAEMHSVYARIKALWDQHGRIVTDEDVTDGKVGEVVRWCRDRLGGSDQNLVGSLRWGEASSNGWSARAVYACLPNCGPNKTWQRYVHEMALYVHQKLPSRAGAGPVGTYNIELARLELQLTALVAGWLADDARGHKRSFPELVLSRPPDLRG